MSCRSGEASSTAEFDAKERVKGKRQDLTRDPDPNVLIAALIAWGTAPDRLYEAWRDGRFTLVRCELQLDEVRRVTRREGLRFRIHAAEAGCMVNDLRRLATMVHELSAVEISPRPLRQITVAMARAARADGLVSGDKRGVLALGAHRGTRILTAQATVALLL